MLNLNIAINNFLKVLQACGSSHLVRWLLRVLALSQAILPTGWPENYKVRNAETFDFVVVGAGSAGAIIAARLSENPQFRVLLIEAGGDPPPASVAPSLFATLAHTEYDWDYKGKMDPGVGGAHPNRTLYITRGKMLGGCSSNNYEIYARGAPQDYNEWSETAPGWDWKSVLPYFKKLENMSDTSVIRNPYNAYLHSSHGPVGVSRPNEYQEFAELNNQMIDAFQEIGIERVLENNGPQTLGVSTPHFTTMNGRRSSTAEAYLRNTIDRPNLFIAKYAKATKILIDQNTLKAYGVEVILKSGEKIKVFAFKEVIVSAGVIDSPKLLMLSGIGPKKHLRKLKIPVVVDLPVGENLHDHQVVPLFFQTQRGLHTALDNLAIVTKLDTFPAPMQTGFYIAGNNSFNRFRNPKPEFQFFSMRIGATASPLVIYGCKSVTNYDDSFCLSLGKSNIFQELIITSVLLLHPKSRGQIKLKSKNHFDDPIIEMGYYRHKEDLDVFAKGLKHIRRLVKTTYFKSIGASIAKLDVTGCNDKRWGTEKYWRCYARNAVSSLLHPVGTCALGPNGVVDEELRVYGVSGLRVADASIMPSIPSGNTNVPTMMIGEKAADLIKSNYKNELFDYEDGLKSGWTKKKKQWKTRITLMKDKVSSNIFPNSYNKVIAAYTNRLGTGSAFLRNGIAVHPS